MTRAHPHRQINVHLDVVDDADVIERIEAQPSMVGYIRELVRRDAYDPRLDHCLTLLAERQIENTKLRKLVRDFDKCLTEAVRLAYIQGHATIYDSTLLDSLHPRMRELGIEEPK